MKNFIVYNTLTGKILRDGFCPANHVSKQAKESFELALPLKGNSAEHYITNSQIQNRPAMNISYAKTNTTITFTGIPLGSQLIHPGGATLISDTTVIWESAVSGIFKFNFSLFPYKDQEFEIELTI